MATWTRASWQRPGARGTTLVPPCQRAVSSGRNRSIGREWGSSTATHAAAEPHRSAARAARTERDEQAALVGGRVGYRLGRRGRGGRGGGRGAQVARRARAGRAVGDTGAGAAVLEAEVLAGAIDEL